jgi:hypothetical protein
MAAAPTALAGPARPPGLASSAPSPSSTAAATPDGTSTVLLGVELIGGEIADTRFRIRRRVRADDPADLGAPLSYAVEVLADDGPEDLEPAAAALSRSRQWVLTALRAGGDLQTVKQLGDRLAQAGHPLKPRTIQTALGELEVAGLARGSEEANGRAVIDHLPLRTPTAARTKPAMVGSGQAVIEPATLSIEGVRDVGWVR